MSLGDLQGWLLHEGVRFELQALTLANVANEFDNLENVEAPDLTRFDWQRLLLAASILSRSSSRPMQEAALRIATAALMNGDRSSIRESGAILLQKLSNQRSVDLAIQRELISPTAGWSVGTLGRIESVRRSLADKVLEESTGRWLAASRFQNEFWEKAALPGAWLSASAPTASGKSFLLQHWLVDRLRTSSAQIAVYIAPTRALVSEIEEGMKRVAFGGQSQMPISIVSLPLADFYRDVKAGSEKAIFVLTQERLHLLANQLDSSLSVDILIVDEAHKIGDRNRGVVLQEAVERITRANPAVQAVFVSPATQNPEVLLIGAPVDTPKISLNSDAPTVLQNVVLASQVPMHPQVWSLELKTNSGSTPLGRISLAKRPVTAQKRLAFVAAATGTRGGTLVYANGAADAEAIANLISQLPIELNQDGLQERENLSELARVGVHASYLLASVVKNGVAFHYGNMPTLLRTEIERLFRDGHLKFLVCTSTLIEGVNLSCRNIVIHGPRKGRRNVMTAPDFWNLAGRAGRWGNEFQGNIICVDPGNKKLWPNGVPQRARFPIEREVDTVLADQEALEAFISTRRERPAARMQQESHLESVSSYLISTYLRAGTLSGLHWANEQSSVDLLRLGQTVAVASVGIELPAELIGKHSGVSAIGLQKLLEAFRASAVPAELVPPLPEDDAAFSGFCKMMTLVTENVFPAFYPVALIPLHARIVIEWLRGYPLSKIIQKQIDYARTHGISKNTATIIRETLRFVEETARFLAPKYFSAYLDVLRYHLREIGQSHLLRDDIDLGLALEFGVSTRTLLSLMQLGLSRMSAVALSEKIADDGFTKQECLSWVQERASTLEGMDFPAAMRREILNIFGLESLYSTRLSDISSNG